MASSVGIRSLQQHASAVIARVAAGEEIEITDRGRPVARLVRPGQTRTEELIQSGRLRPARRRLERLPDLISVPAGTPTASELLAEARADER